MMEVVLKYVDGCHEDLECAAVLLRAKKTFYVPFLCHQALFKLLRGCFLETQNRYPPAESYLPDLADASGAGALLDNQDRSILHELSFYPQVIAHPVYRKKILGKSSEDAEILEKTKEITGKIMRLLKGEEGHE